MNPFSLSALPPAKQYRSIAQIYPDSYCKESTDPYTKARIILMNGAEFESNWLTHRLARQTTNNDLRRDLAAARYADKQQQQQLFLHKPDDESILEHTISYEQLAVDLTAELAKRACDCNVKTALDFALLEDFDHLYRYANLLEMQEGIYAEHLVGRYTEIMPGRPTIAHHRCPLDNVKQPICAKAADKFTVMSTLIITAAEQQTMNYYMNVSAFAKNDLARSLYEEIALVEEEHVTQYESLQDGSATPLEILLWGEYTNCYLYWSCAETETDSRIKPMWENFFEIEVGKLHAAAQLLQKYEGKHHCQVIPDPEFPAPLHLHENIDYVRKILASTVQFTSCRESYQTVDKLDQNADFYAFQRSFVPCENEVPSHRVICKKIEKDGCDYRYETAPNPHRALQNRSCDNTDVGRVAGAAESSCFSCNPK